MTKSLTVAKNTPVTFSAIQIYRNTNVIKWWIRKFIKLIMVYEEKMMVGIFRIDRMIPF
jgi:hypothetical protein